MEVMIILLPLALGLGLFFVIAFVWMVRIDQYEDLETPKYRMLLEDQNINKNVKFQKEET